MLDLTKEEANAILQLINRVSVNGQEVETVAFLKNKLRTYIESPQNEESKTKDNEKTK